MKSNALAAYDAAFAETDGKTHWDGCYESHYDCAIARVEELERTVATWKRGVSEYFIDRSIYDHIGGGMGNPIARRVAELLEKDHG